VIKDGGLHQLYIRVNSITNHRIGEDEGKDGEGARRAVASHEQVYRSISKHPFPLALLCMSLCPTIYGHELVKAGLLLSLVGGTANSSNADHTSSASVSVHLRSDIHVLLVGDPGLGKSQLLRACASVAARGIFVCGNTSSTAGLTVTIARDGRDTSIEAGALVLADQGVCCIDELDKLSCDYHALLEGMEQQRISIAKAGVVTSLKSRASIIAAANPVNGHYQRKKSLIENLKMPSALISRFDIVFLLLDRPDESHDRRISEHIMRSQHLSSTTASSSAAHATRFPSKEELVGTGAESRSFGQRLRYQCNQLTSSSIPLTVMRDYIEHARKAIQPKLTTDAAKILQRMYLSLRSQASLGKTMPVTTRHLESLIRLAQARAKIELRDQVTAADADDVVELLQEAMLDAFTNDLGEVELGLGRKGGVGLAKQIKAVVKTLASEAEIKQSKIFTLAELTEIVRRLKIDREIDSIVEVMRTECYLLYKGPRLYQLQT
jgi:DNA helicase MCM8